MFMNLMVLLIPSPKDPQTTDFNKEKPVSSRQYFRYLMILSSTRDPRSTFLKTIWLLVPLHPLLSMKQTEWLSPSGHNSNFGPFF